VVNFDLGERFPRSQQRGSLPPPRTRRVALRFLMPNPAFGGQFGPENKLIEGQPNEYDVICRNTSVLAFHLWPTIFAGVPFRLQNICWNGVPPHHYTPAISRYLLPSGRSAANPPTAVSALNQWDRQTDGRMYRQTKR